MSATTTIAKQREQIAALHEAVRKARREHPDTAALQTENEALRQATQMYEQRLFEIAQSAKLDPVGKAVQGAMLRGNNQRGAVVKSREHKGEKMIGDRPGGAGTFRLAAPTEPVAKSQAERDADATARMDEHDAEKIERMAKARADIFGKRTL